MPETTLSHATQIRAMPCASAKQGINEAVLVKIFATQFPKEGHALRSSDKHLHILFVEVFLTLFDLLLQIVELFCSATLPV